MTADLENIRARWRKISQEALGALPNRRFYFGKSWVYPARYELSFMWAKGKDLYKGDQIYRHRIAFYVQKPILFERY
jgi:hypothetical protein